MISAIVPARDAAAHLARALPALRAALPADAEILVVDDGSSDETAAAAAALERVRVLRHGRPRGPAAARNTAAREAKGHVLVFLDADCVPHANAVETLLAVLDDPSVAAAFGSYDDRPDARSWVSLYKNLAHHFVHQRSPGEAETFWAGFGAVRRSVFEAVSGFDETYARPSIEDVELGYRLKAAGHRVRLVREAQVTHRKRWTLGSWLVSDLRDRAIPWARLLRRGRSLPRGLNFTARDRVASGLVLVASALIGASVAMAAFGAWPWRWALAGGTLALVAALLLDAPFLRFAARHVSPLFALACAGFQVLHRVAGVLGFAVGTILGLLEPRPPTARSSKAPA